MGASAPAPQCCHNGTGNTETVKELVQDPMAPSWQVLPEEDSAALQIPPTQQIWQHLPGRLPYGHVEHNCPTIEEEEGPGHEGEAMGRLPTLGPSEVQAQNSEDKRNRQLHLLKLEDPSPVLNAASPSATPPNAAVWKKPKAAVMSAMKYLGLASGAGAFLEEFTAELLEFALAVCTSNAAECARFAEAAGREERRALQLLNQSAKKNWAVETTRSCGNFCPDTS